MRRGMGATVRGALAGPVIMPQQMHGQGVAPDLCQHPAFVLRAFWDELERRGLPLDELERMSGVCRPAKDDFASAINRADVLRIFEAAVRLAGDEDLGISVAEAIRCVGLHLIGHLVLASSSFREAIRSTCATGEHWRQPVIEACGEAKVRVGFYREPGGRPQIGEKMASQMMAVILHEMVLHFRSAHSELPTVQFAFQQPARLGIYRRVFPGAVEFGAEGTFVRFPAGDLDRCRVGADPALAAQLMKLAKDVYRTPERDATWAGRVRRALAAHDSPRAVSPRAIASQLKLTSRALWRRLAREGTSFSAVLDQVLYERTQALLRQDGRLFSDIAEELGYSELSSFHRAFRRWSGGITPSEFRRRGPQR